MDTGYVEKSQTLTETTSLVYLRVTDPVGQQAHYIAVAVHPPGAKPTFRSAETVTPELAPLVFSQRAMFNGYRADAPIHKKQAVALDGAQLTLV